jgi:hypothetical protein
MNDIWLFALGTLVFGGYLFGLLSMINKQHKIQAREQTNYEKSLANKTGEGR